MPTLALLRHGQSQWNLENRFTGWWDVDLSEKGIDEARAAGALLMLTNVCLKIRLVKELALGWFIFYFRMD